MFTLSTDDTAMAREGEIVDIDPEAAREGVRPRRDASHRYVRFDNQVAWNSRDLKRKQLLFQPCLRRFFSRSEFYAVDTARHVQHIPSTLRRFAAPCLDAAPPFLLDVYSTWTISALPP